MEKLPVLAIRDLIMFPKMVAPLFVAREFSIRALENANKHDNKVVLVGQKDVAQEIPKSNGLFKVGVVSKVLQVLRLRNASVKVLVEGVERVKLSKIHMSESGFLECSVKSIIANTNFDNQHYITLRKTVQEQFIEYAKLHNVLTSDIVSKIIQIEDPWDFCNAIASNLTISLEKKQKLLELNDINQKLEELLILISGELDSLQAEYRIKERVKEQLEKNQKEYYLNEQLKAIQKELGDENIRSGSIGDLRRRAKKVKLSPDAKKKVKSELSKLETMYSMSAEVNIIQSYVEWILDLPWGVYSKDVTNIIQAEELLNNRHYGLDKVKERIIEHIAVNMRTQNLKSPIICLVGPPGVGKTSLASSIAKAVGRKFVKVSLGGLRDEAEIKGHRKTYIGALPGKIIQALKKAGTSNPVVLLDEIDKMGGNYRGDPESALLEVLDPEQNKSFVDHYMEIEYDLSNVMFIATANSINMQKPLLDRMEIIRISGYMHEEKCEIANSFLVPSLRKNHGLAENEITIDNAAINDVIQYYTREAGVRSLERSLAKIMRKSVKKLLDQSDPDIHVNNTNLDKFLGVRKYDHSRIAKQNTVGAVNGLAYTEVGGDLLSLETVVMPGKGEIKITGNLGDVMQESAQAAIGYLRSKSRSLGIEPSVFKEQDIHIHVPEGATPKDGPSAGITMFTSILSALTSVAVKREIAMTGEITLLGNVLPIGGLKEKLLAAAAGGVKTVIIPQENAKDLVEMPSSLTERLTIVPVSHVDEVINLALENSSLCTKNSKK